MTYKWRAANPEGTKRILLKSRHKARKYPEPTRPKTATCEICSREPSAKKSLALDHCHATGRFRGWLCDRCNLALGLFNDKTDLLFKAIKYLTSETICVN